MKAHIFNYRLTISILVGILVSCSSSRLTVDQYVTQVGILQKNLTTGFATPSYKVEARYLPADLLAIKQVQNKDDLQGLKTLREEFNEMMHFSFKLSDKNLGAILNPQVLSSTELGRRLNYYQSWVGQDIVLLNGTDTISCEMVHIERTYGLTPHNMLMVAFKAKPSNKRIELHYEDRVLQTPKMRFVFDPSIINELPILEL